MADKLLKDLCTLNITVTSEVNDLDELLSHHLFVFMTCLYCTH